MKFTVYIYKKDIEDDKKSFKFIQDAFQYLGKLDMGNRVERCVLDNGEDVLLDVKRNIDGNLASWKKSEA